MTLDRTGHWDEAVALGTNCWPARGPSSIYQIHPLQVLGLIRARRGEPGAWEYLDEAAAAADTTGEPQWIIPARLARAEAHWLQAEPHLARHEAELADDVSTGFDAWERGELTGWLRRTGSSRRPRGELAGPYQREAEGDWEEAAQLWLGRGCLYEAALALHDSGQDAALRRALKIFTDLGAPAAAQLTRHKMRALGIRSIPAGRGPRPAPIRPG